MDEFFLCDTNLFNDVLTTYVLNGKVQEIKLLLNEKFEKEKLDKIDIDIKKADLIIWNGVLVREICKKGITKEEMAKLYNKFYKRIDSKKLVQELNVLEEEMFLEYAKVIRLDAEITKNLNVNRILKYIYMNLEDWTSIEKICKDLNISVGYASQIFKKEVGTSIIKYSKEAKIERAKCLLKTTDENILTISNKLGFHDESHFCRTFKKVSGVSPLKYKRENKG